MSVDNDGQFSEISFRERLSATIADLGMDRAVQASQRSAKTISRYMDGATEPPFGVIALIASAAGVSVDWLATGASPSDSLPKSPHVQSGTQPEHSSEAMQQIVDQSALQDGAFVVLPRYEVQASAGHGLIAPDDELRDFVAFNESYLRAAGINPRNAHIIRVHGRSMVPTLVDGEWVIVDTSKTRIMSGEIYAVVYMGEVRIKRLRAERGGAVVMMSDNQTEVYPEVRVEGPDLEDFKVVGRVDRHIRSL